MSAEYTVAIVGATGMVGREMIEVLQERGFPLKELRLLASPRSAGEKIEAFGKENRVELTTDDAFDGVDITIMSAGGAASEVWAPKAAARGSVVIDNSSFWRMDDAVPLVVPEVNPEDLKNFQNKRIIANPNCSTIQMVVALAPLHKLAAIKRVVVSTYQAVSGAGKDATEELSQQVTDLFHQREMVLNTFPKQMAFNCLPHIDVFLDDGYTKEEHKMRLETQKILSPDIKVSATCVRVPVFTGHALSINVEFASKVETEAAREALKEAPGIMVLDSPKEGVYPTQVDCVGSDATLVGRLREDPSQANTLNFWCVADNLRKGAATNAVQIAELMVRDYLDQDER